jgi:hypothetical protein
MVSKKLKIKVKDMWEHISPALIEKSFIKCSISNSHDFIQYSDDVCVGSADDETVTVMKAMETKIL